ncbi:MAG TPA: DUF559 domain-containing protein [Candidatus Angelobacter sp.]|nr:DUF559 domain-containing protein [Candidatus Angelobacter sp.]
MSEERKTITTGAEAHDEHALWENTIGAQFSSSLHTFMRLHSWPALCSTPAELAEIIADQAEEQAGKPLDRQFLRITTLALLVQSATTSMQNLVAECSAVCESPIEMAMFFALAIVAREGDRGVTFVLPGGLMGDAEGDLHLTIQPQAQIGAYRVDFLLTAQLIEEEGRIAVYRKQAAVECDGYEWHDSTKEQAIRDRRRDRDLQIQGFSVFRYAGAEIWVNVFKCAQEVISFLVDAVEGQRVAASLRGKGPGREGSQQACAQASG